jgi:hypothetical protein
LCLLSSLCLLFSLRKCLSDPETSFLFCEFMTGSSQQFSSESSRFLFLSSLSIGVLFSHGLCQLKSMEGIEVTKGKEVAFHSSFLTRMRFVVETMM